MPLEWRFAAGVRGLPLGRGFAARGGALALEYAHRAPQKNALAAQRQFFSIRFHRPVSGYDAYNRSDS